MVCLRIGCPCQDGVLQWRNVSSQTSLPHRVLQQVPLPPGTLGPNELVRFICSVLTQVDNTSTISLSTNQNWKLAPQPETTIIDGSKAHKDVFMAYFWSCPATFAKSFSRPVGPSKPSCEACSRRWRLLRCVWPR